MSNIKIPVLVNLRKWRDNNVPESVWKNEYLQAYLRRKELYEAIAAILFGLAYAAIGIMFAISMMR